MKILRLIFVWLLFLTSSASAGINNPGSASGSGPSPSTAQSGVVGFDPTMFPFVNFFKSMNPSNGFNNSGTTFIYPNFLLQGSNLPTGTLPSQLNYLPNLPSNYFGEYVMGFTGTITGTGTQGAEIGFNSANNGGSAKVYAIGGGTTITGCSNGNVPPCTVNSVLTVTGTNPSVTFDFSAGVTAAANNGSGLVRLTTVAQGYSNGQAVTVTGVVGSDGHGCGANGAFTISNQSSTSIDLVGSTFPGGCTYSSGGQVFPYQAASAFTPSFSFASGSAYSGMTSGILCKLADYNADNTCQTTGGKTQWAGGFNDDFVSALATLRPHHIRFLDTNSAIFQPGADYNGYQTTSAFTYEGNGAFFTMTNWFGSTSGTNAYTASCTAPCTYALTGGAPADGDFVQFYNVNANTGMTTTLAITDKNSVTSSAIPLLPESPSQYTIAFGGTKTTGDTVALKFTSTCLGGGSHTTTPYTVLNTDTIGSIQNAVTVIAQNDATLSAQSLAMFFGNPFGGSGTFYASYASNACSVTISSVITGSATETVSVGNMAVGQLAANTLYTATYNKLLGSWIVNTTDLGGQGVAWPYIIQIDLAKAVSTKSGFNTGCWLQGNLLWSNASWQSLFNLENSSQCPGGAIYEIGNEIWNGRNFITSTASSIAGSIGLGANSQVEYEMLRNRQVFAIGKTTYGSIGTHFFPSAMFIESGASSALLQGQNLCGTSCSNTAYQNAIGVDYTAAPNQPLQFTYAIGDAPYYHGEILTDGGSYQSSGSYGSWSATSSSVSGSVLTVNGTVTGTIYPGNGISSCDGVYIKNPTPSNFASGQLTGQITTTLTAPYNRNGGALSVTSGTGILANMWVYDATTGFVSGIVTSVVGNTVNIGPAAGSPPLTGFPSAGSNDTMVFGGLTGTYQLNTTSCSASSGTITGGDVLGLQYAADNYNSIGGALGSQQDGLNWVYQDAYSSVRHGVMEPQQTVQTVYDTANLIGAVASANSLKVWDYEGGYAAFPPDTGHATGMGLPSAAYGGTGGYVDVLQKAFKNNVLLKTLETARHNNELTFLPSGSQTMWYDFEGQPTSEWAIYPNGLYSTPFQSYNAICDYNGGSC